MAGPPGDRWIALCSSPLPVGEVTGWAKTPRCGAVVTFCGSVRDHSEDRPGVHSLTYEAYERYATDRMAQVADQAAVRWADIERIAIVHRVGTLEVGEDAVVVAVSAPHRHEAFEGARFCIDTVKATVPLWKLERWDGGEDWAPCHHDGAPHAGAEPSPGSPLPPAPLPVP